MNARFEHYLKKHLIRVNKNLHLSPGDPQFHEKCLRYMDPYSPEAHYKLGEKNEEIGNTDKAVYHYSMATKRFSPFLHLAKHRLELVKATAPNIAQVNSSNNQKHTKTIALIIVLLLSLLIFFFLLFSTSLPKNGSLFQTTHNIGLAVSSEKITPLQFVGANFVRTALRYYIETNGAPPSSITQLIADFPNNYMSFIPIEPISGSNEVVTIYSGDGGWVYDAKAADLVSMFYPNTPGFQNSDMVSTLTYEPVSISVSKENYSLLLSVGPYLLKKIPIGLGKNDRTPLETLPISVRALQPKGMTVNAYGEAGLGLGEIAIHGTSDISSIGANKSLGCIRVSNEDILQIYPFVPLGTTVVISNINEVESGNAISIKKLLPAHDKAAAESSGNHIFNWLG